MIGRDHPCANGLTPECFEKYPDDAKRAFAYRLMNSLFPPHITRRLPRIFRPRDYDWGVAWLPWLYYIFEDWWLLEEPLPEDWTPDDPLPPGEIIEPGGDLPPGWDPSQPLPPDIIPGPGPVFPPGWTPGDPLPPGVIIPPGTEFPPGWTPGDPLPPGVIIPPGTEFPPGWTPPDPLPPGVDVPLPPGFPPGWTPGDPLPPGAAIDPGSISLPVWWSSLPPIYVQLWEPGPVHRPPQFTKLALPEITGFYFKVTRGDGTIITEETNGYFDVYNSSEDWISSTTFSYDPATKYWKVEIAEEDIDISGYWVFLDYDDGIETQYPSRYKGDDQFKVADLTGFGNYEADVPYWVVGAGAWDNPSDYTYPTSPDEVGWSDAAFPAGWGITHITLYFIRHGYFTTIDETVDANTWRMTVKSSIPYRIRYYGTPQGSSELFWVYLLGSFDDDCHYKLTTSEGDEKVIVAEGLGLSVYHEYEGNVGGREHSILWELTHKTSLTDYKVVAADKSPICFIYNDYDW